MTPDVNVLLAALRSDHPHHGAARAWLEAALAAAETGAAFTVMPTVLNSLLRLATSPRIFVHPTPIANAVGPLKSLFGIGFIGFAANAVVFAIVSAFTKKVDPERLTELGREMDREG